jgi:CRP-like cAMP-binding protein
VSERPTNAFLRALAPDSFERISAQLSPIEFRVGDVLDEPDRKVEWVHFPLNAVLSVLTTTEKGEQVETAVIGNEGGLGVVEVCGSGVSSMTSLVQVDGRGLRIPAAAFRRLIAADEDLWNHAWRLVELNISESRQSGLCQALHAVEPRLARWLLECSDRSGGRPLLPLTQEFLAAMLGVQRTTVTAFASQMQKAGLIRYSRGRVEITDMKGLEGHACECRRATQAHRARLKLEPLVVGAPGLRLVVG